MASKQPKIQQTTVTCEVCKKQIVPEGNYPIPVNYVVFNSHNLCWGCVKSGKSNQFRLI